MSGLSIKAAMAISMVYVGGFTWLLTRVGRPVVGAPPPVVVRAALDPADVHVAMHLPRQAPGFAHASALERETAAARESADRLTVHMVEFSEQQRDGAVELLPPIAALAPEESEGELDLFDEGVGSSSVRLASADGGGDERFDGSEADRSSGPLPYGRGSAGAHTGASEPEAQAEAGSRGEPAVVDAPPTLEPGRAYKVYIVQKGDSLWKIVRSEWKRADAELIRLIVQANPQLDKTNKIFEGQKLFVPLDKEGGGLPEIRLASHVPDESEERMAQALRWYTIRKNDSLARIARRELKDERRWREIADLNDSINARKPVIHPGTKIKLPPT